VGEKRLQRWRSYSIAGCPGDDNTFELCIVRAQPGLGSRYLFEEVREGAELRFKGPEGSFVPPKELDKDICHDLHRARYRTLPQYDTGYPALGTAAPPAST
jgi:CDP-4-dehydro-6-deoxyglucose reductase